MIISILSDAIIDALLDTLKLIPFLFLTYLLMEYLEDKVEGKTKAAISRAGSWGPVWGGVLGALPQCGFSAAASNLFAGRVISMGTLIAVFLSTSDEMLPIFISNKVNAMEIAQIIGIKVFIGIFVGFLVDFIINSRRGATKIKMDIHHFCEHEHCECGHGILKPAVIHTLKIVAFILGISFVLNLIVGIVGTDAIANSWIGMPVIGEIIAGLVGMIPNCGASVALTTLYIEGAITMGTLIAGLLVGAGVGVLILFRVNENKKENFVILGILYITGVAFGIIINAFM